MRRALLTLCITSSLTGCSGLSGYDDYDQPTIGSLRPATLPAVPAHAMEHTRSTAIHHYQTFLEESPDSQFVPQAMQRLADLYLEDEQESLLQGTLPPGESRAAQLYAELLQRFPDNAQNDNALYQMAHAHEQSGAVEPSMAALSSYASSYSNGDKYDEAQFRRGEYLFVRGDYRQAETAYQAVLDHNPDSEFYQQTLYKLGWSRFKQADYESALDAYSRLLDINIGEHSSADTPDQLGKADMERVDDTLRAVCLSFSYLGDPAAIADYYRQHGARQYEPLVYARLAALHLDKERYSDAAETYALFADSHPQHREAPLFQSRVIDVYKQAGFRERVLAEKQSFIERYAPAAAYWQQHDPAESPEVLAQVQRHLRDVARHYHALAQSSGKTADYADAGHWYQLYLRAFPNDAQTPYMNFLYAELLSGSGQHGLAASQYEHTAYDYPRHDKSAEAGYAALLAYQSHATSLSAQAKPDWHRAGINSSLRFIGQFPEHPQALPVRLLAAQRLYALGDYPQAITTATPLTTATAVAPAMQTSAWTLVAHAQFEQADYQRAELAYRHLLADSTVDSQQRGQLQDKLAASIYKQGEQERAAGNLAGAAEHFLRIADAVPGSPVNVTAQYDAAAAYIALQQWPQAISILERWRRNNPGHKLHADASRKLAVLYQENQQPVQAAQEFSRLAESEQDPGLKREATLTAATLYQQAGQTQPAITAYQNFVSRYPQPVEPAMEARYQLSLLYAGSGQHDKRRYWQQQLIDADRQAGPQRNQRTRYLAATARLVLAGDSYRAYQQIQLQEPLQKNLALKKQYMQASIDGYKQAADYAVAAVTTESTYRIGAIYADFGHALLNSERPRKLNADELEQYEILLEEQAYPFEEKAISVHEANAERTAAGLYDEWIRKSLNALADLLPVRYAKLEKGEKLVATLQ
jgi:outer membrane protein assembly factor BamD (BamD/ComL family)